VILSPGIKVIEEKPYLEDKGGDEVFLQGQGSENSKYLNILLVLV
jgi:hypothetical protein